MSNPSDPAADQPEIQAGRYYGSSIPYLPINGYPGKLIAIEGTDGVGRTTQIQLLREWLEVRGYGVVETGWTRSPLMQPTIELAKSSNTLNKLTFVLLYATDFADRLEKEIIPALKAGFVVLSDRYIFTALARAGVRGIDRAWLRGLYGFAIAPHMVFYLKVDVDTLIGRILESRGMDFWESGMDMKSADDIYDSFRLTRTSCCASTRRWPTSSTSGPSTRGDRSITSRTSCASRWPPSSNRPTSRPRRSRADPRWNQARPDLPAFTLTVWTALALTNLIICWRWPVRSRCGCSPNVVMPSSRPVHLLFTGVRLDRTAAITPRRRRGETNEDQVGMGGVVLRVRWSDGRCRAPRRPAPRPDPGRRDGAAGQLRRGAGHTRRGRSGDLAQQSEPAALARHRYSQRRRDSCLRPLRAPRAGDAATECASRLGR